MAEEEERQEPAPRGPVVRVKVAHGWPQDEYMDLPLEAAQHWNVDAWRRP